MHVIEWWPVLLGWPAVFLALTLSAFGVFQRRPSFLFTAMLLILPISLYLAGAPRLPFVSLLAPMALLGAGLATQHGKASLAIAMALSVVLFFGLLLVLVLRQPEH
jgi:hypothetical protein